MLRLVQGHTNLDQIQSPDSNLQVCAKQTACWSISRLFFTFKSNLHSQPVQLFCQCQCQCHIGSLVDPSSNTLEDLMEDRWNNSYSTLTLPHNDIKTICSAISSISVARQSQTSQQNKSLGNNQTPGVTRASFCGRAPTNLFFSAEGQLIAFS